MIEIEATLIIVSDNPDVVARQIADRTELGNFQLQPQRTQEIHDLYFDTTDSALKGKKLGLRLRKRDDARQITLKGDALPNSHGIVERLEIELPWSEVALAGILKELRGRQIVLAEPALKWADAEPSQVMQRLGLELVQERRCRRQVRHLVPREEPKNTVLAELAIDFVVYHFDLDIFHHEIEIEAMLPGQLLVLQNAVENLRQDFGPVLRTWDHSKLALGKAIEALRREGMFRDAFVSNGYLMPAAYGEIEKRFGSPSCF